MTPQPASQPARMIAEVGARVHLSGAAPPAFWEAIVDSLTFANPKWIENDRMGRWNGGTPRYIEAYEIGNDGIFIPRGFLDRLLAIADCHDVEIRMDDRMRTLPEVNFTFKGTLRDFQAEAVRDILARDMGTLAAPTGSGKTVIGLYVIAKRRQPALVIVHTKELLNQWIDRIETFLGIPRSEVGTIGNGKRFIGPRISVGIVNSVYKCAHEIAPRVGHVVVDECHRTPSRTFTEAVSAFDARFLLGLSATPWRRDRLGRLIFWYLGDRVHSVEPALLQRSGDIMRAAVKWRRTSFETTHDPSEEYPRMLSELTADPGRNVLIARDVAREARNGGGGVLVLSDRKDHVNTLAVLLEARNVPTSVLVGDMSAKARVESLEAVKNGSARVLVATGQLIGEGFDLPAMAALFLATPIKFDGRVLQYVGRVLRPAPGKDTAVVHDYIDVHVGPLKASARARMRVYERHGMEGAHGE